MLTSKEDIEALKRQLILHPSYLNIVESMEEDIEVLKILKDKKVDIGLVDYTTLEFYNARFSIYETDRCLTEDEFYKIKSWVRTINTYE